MCTCLQDTAEKLSKKHRQHGVDACVIVRTSIDTRIVHFINRRGEIRRSSHSRSVYIRPEFCPLCGSKLDKTEARIWHDADGREV